MSVSVVIAESLKPPFPWFGGKARSAAIIWSRLGTVRNYVEPFAGSLAVLLGRPTPFDGPETVNDADGLLCNFWRAVQHDHDTVAEYADQPVNENDLHARHSWLVAQRDTFVPRLEGDPDFYDAKVAGWWVWGISCWIGSGWCSGKGPWQSVEMPDGSRQLVHLGSAGQGVNRQLVHLGNAGQGVHRKRDGHREALFAYMQALSGRLRHVRVCCGDWSRVMGESPMLVRGKGFTPVGVVLDPPYADTARRQADLYRVDSGTVAHDVREWAIAHGADPRYRIALCCYEGEHVMPSTWTEVEGRPGRGHGFGGQSRGEDGYANAGRERIWFSPHCLKRVASRMKQAELFDDDTVEVLTT